MGAHTGMAAVPMQITTTFRDMSPSAGLQAAAERWIGRLEQIHDRIVSCHVTIERPQRQGSAFRIHIAISVAGGDLEVSHQGGKDDAYVALADAFRTARRQLLEHVDPHRDPQPARLGKRPGSGGFAGFFARKA